MTSNLPFILASASPRRLQLLSQAGITPSQVLPADIDETPRKDEPPQAYARRIAQEKAHAVSGQHPEAVVLAADTVVAVGQRILPKAEDEKTALSCLKLLSGRRHRVYTAVCLTQGAIMRRKLVMTQVQFSRLTPAQISAYVASGEWHGKAGGYAIQGQAAAFIPRINGSYTNVVGLPLAETLAMLKHMGVCL